MKLFVLLLYTPTVTFIVKLSEELFLTVTFIPLSSKVLLNFTVSSPGTERRKSL